MTIRNYVRRVIATEFDGTNAEEIVEAFPKGSFSIENGALYFFNLNGNGRGAVPVGHVCFFESTDPKVVPLDEFKSQFQEVV